MGLTATDYFLDDGENSYQELENGEIGKTTENGVISGPTTGETPSEMNVPVSNEGNNTYQELENGEIGKTTENGVISGPTTGETPTEINATVGNEGISDSELNHGEGDLDSGGGIVIKAARSKIIGRIYLTQCETDKSVVITIRI